MKRSNSSRVTCQVPSSFRDAFRNVFWSRWRRSSPVGAAAGDRLVFGSFRELAAASATFIPAIRAASVSVRTRSDRCRSSSGVRLARGPVSRDRTQRLTGAGMLADQHPLQMHRRNLAVEPERGAASAEPNGQVPRRSLRSSDPRRPVRSGSGAARPAPSTRRSSRPALQRRLASPRRIPSGVTETSTGQSPLLFALGGLSRKSTVCAITKTCWRRLLTPSRHIDDANRPTTRYQPTTGQVPSDRRTLVSPHVDVDRDRCSFRAILEREADPHDGLLADDPRHRIRVEVPDQRDRVHRSCSSLAVIHIGDCLHSLQGAVAPCCG